MNLIGVRGSREEDKKKAPAIGAFLRIESQRPSLSQIKKCSMINNGLIWLLTETKVSASSEEEQYPLGVRVRQIFCI